MHITPVGVSFGKLIKIDKTGISISMDDAKKPQEVATVNTIYSGAKASTLSASATNIIGTAFVSQASGMNSSGIVPAVIASITPYAAPVTLALSNENPSITGLTLSTIAQSCHFNNISKNENNEPNIPD